PSGKASALDRFFVDMPHPVVPDARLLGDFYLPGDATLGALGDIYGLQIDAREAAMTLADWFEMQLGDDVHEGDSLPLGAIKLIADKTEDGRVTTVGLDLAEHVAIEDAPAGLRARLRAKLKRLRETLRPAPGPP